MISLHRFDRQFLSAQAKSGDRSICNRITDSLSDFDLGKVSKNNRFFLVDLSQMCLPTHPRFFVRFGKTKGEIRVEKGDFRGDLGGF